MPLPLTGNNSYRTVSEGVVHTCQAAFMRVLQTRTAGFILWQGKRRVLLLSKDNAGRPRPAFSPCVCLASCPVCDLPRLPPAHQPPGLYKLVAEGEWVGPLTADAADLTDRDIYEVRAGWRRRNLRCLAGWRSAREVWLNP
jgi:hypothetical protein